MKTEENVLTIEVIEATLSLDLLKEVEKRVDLKGNYESLVLDCSEATSISEEAAQCLTALSERLSENKKKLVFMAGKSVLEQVGSRLKLAGSARSLIEFNRLVLKPEDLGSGVDLVTLINAFVSAVVQAVDGYAHTTPVPGVACEVPDLHSGKVEVAGWIEFSTQELEGSLILSFPVKTFLGVASKIIGQKYETLEPEVIDWSSELLNVTSSLARESLGRTGFKMNVGLPAVVPQEMMKDIISGEEKRITYPFKTEDGEFYLEIFTRPKKK